MKTAVIAAAIATTLAGASAQADQLRFTTQGLFGATATLGGADVGGAAFTLTGLFTPAFDIDAGTNGVGRFALLTSRFIIDGASVALLDATAEFILFDADFSRGGFGVLVSDPDAGNRVAGASSGGTATPTIDADLPSITSITQGNTDNTGTWGFQTVSDGDLVVDAGLVTLTGSAVISAVPIPAAGGLLAAAALALAGAARSRRPAA